MSERKRKAPALGCRKNGLREKTREKLRIVVGFDDETFAQIRGLAIKNDHSFGAQVRELVEFGLMDVLDP